MVDHPKHYKMGNPAYEPYKVIGEWGCNFNIGNAIKYLARYLQKWNPIEDLEKAKKYIDFEIERLSLTESPVETSDAAVSTMENSNAEKPCFFGFGTTTNPHCERLVDKMNRALDGGMSRIDAMKNILKMNDREIEEVMHMDNADEIGNKIAEKVAKVVNEEDYQSHGKYFEVSPY